MLDLSVVSRKMTQGRPAAKMTLVHGAREQAALPAVVQEARSVMEQRSSGAAIDRRALADRVYELMRRDLLVAQERRGGRRW